MSNHNIAHTSAVKLTLGGGYSVHIFNVVLMVGSQPEGAPPIAVRAYAVDENRPESMMVSLDLGVGPFDIEHIRKVAAQAVLSGHMGNINIIRPNAQTEAGLNRLLDAIEDLDN